MTKFAQSWILSPMGVLSLIVYQEALQYARQTYKRHKELKPIIFLLMRLLFRQGLARVSGRPAAVLSEVLRHALRSLIPLRIA